MANKEKWITIYNTPVLLKKWSKTIQAEITLEERDVKSLAQALLLLDSFGFEHSWTTFDRGYYDSIENIHMELDINEKDLNKENFLKAIQDTQTVQQFTESLF